VSNAKIFQETIHLHVPFNIYNDNKIISLQINILMKADLKVNFMNTFQKAVTMNQHITHTGLPTALMSLIKPSRASSLAGQSRAST
jgi:uncharacterized protein YdgA (DUF945 family)